ncbi:MAG: zinc metalloprotease [Alphaproteobacteria bacterium]|nr:MAG: zinc metalloprotease [Alphaproteobacteria bacterium]
MTEYYVGDIPLILRRHPRAKHLKLRFDVKSYSAILTLPPGVSDRKARQFANKHHDWICEQYDKSPVTVPLRAGEVIPYQGHPVKIISAPGKVAGVTLHEETLIVGGPESGFETRLQNWLKKQARLTLGAAVEKYVRPLGCRPHKIMIRDTKSRWGSCSSRKTLSFSWRLIMAPSPVLNYVVAHEMAHLVEMNHSPDFWTLVEKLYPNWSEARRWLKSEGQGLMLIG